MVYTITVEDVGEQAVSFINFVKSLSRDYKFLSIKTANETFALTTEQEAELSRRFQYVLQHPDEGKSWEEVEQKLLAK